MSHPIPGKGILFACCLSILPFCTDAQVTLHDSKELIDLGIARYDEGKYKEALEAFRKVPEGDTNFHIAKYEMALSAFADSAFAEARNHALEGLTLPFADRRSMRLLLGHSYDGLDKKDSAFYYYDQLLKENPHDHIAYYEKGVVYFNRKEYDKALEAFRTGLLINPYHFNLHRMTGVTYMRQGRLTEATLSLATSLLFTNNMQTARSSIILLNNMASQTAEIAKFYEEKDSRYEHELFNEIDAIINARLALSKGYKVPSVMSDDNIIRLLYVVMEKAKYSADDTSFAMQYYVPLFTNIFKEDQFDPFVLLLFSNFGLETVDQYAKKQKRDISRVRDIVFPYADKIVNTRTLNFKAREKAPLKYFYNSNSNVYIDAAFRMGKEDIEFTGGPAVYYKNNVLTAAGNFNKDGKKEGEWNYYFSFGKLRLTEQYKNGTIQGKAYSYRLNGHLKEITTYDAEGNEITEETFTYNGQPHIRTKFLTGKESELVYLHKNGHEQQKLRIKNDKVSDGKYQTYYVNGKLSREMDIKDGKLHGVMREYYENGQLREEIEYRNGDRHGKYTSWYDDGQKEDEYQYANGKPDGPYINFSQEGLVVAKGNFKNGSKHGIESLFADGQEYATVEHDGAEIVAYSYKTPEGKEIAERKKQGLEVVKYYYPNGNLKTMLPNQKGIINGEAKYYFSTGAVRETVPFRDGNREGIAVEYFRTGKKSIERTYKQDELTGAYRSYFPNGKVQAEGWLINDRKEGIWKYYNSQGKKDNEIFFLDDQKNGPAHQFDANERLTSTEYFDKGFLIGLKQYDTTGKIFHQQSFPKGNGKYQLVYLNGKPSFEAELKQGLYQGAYKMYFPNGRVSETGFYQDGKKDSAVIVYFPDGSIRIKGTFKKGMREGLWVFNARNGKPEREMNYKNGDEHGKDKIYVQGSLRYEYNMKHDYKEGDQIYYADNGKIACVLRYKNRDLVGYSYPGKDGKLLPFVPVKDGTAVIKASHPDGKPAAEMSFVQNIMTGRQNLYYSNGQLAEERNVMNIDFNGPFKRYYMNGQLAFETSYTDDEIHGWERSYSETGKLLTEGRYEHGNLDGAYKITNEQTGKTMELIYSSGQLREIKE